jgi:CHAD domain-containing protein
MKRRALKTFAPGLAAATALGAAVVAARVQRGRLKRRKREAERVFAVRAGRPVEEELPRIALGRIEHAAELLEADGARPKPTTVHEVRKDLKRLRAVVRLSRPVLGDELSREQAATYRDIARLLGDDRDRTVLVETLDALVAATPGLKRRRYAKLRKRLGAAPAGGGPPSGAAVLARLRATESDVVRWHLNGNTLGELRSGLHRIYRRGRADYRAARAQPDAEHLHEWRKRVKDLWYAAEILQPAAPAQLKPVAKQAKRLGEALGTDHDLWVLREAVGRHRTALAGKDRKRLLKAIDRRRAALAKDALKLGAKLYADKPDRALRRLSKGWEKRLRASRRR